MTESVFASFEQYAYPYRFAGSLLVSTIAGGIPSDPKVAKNWLDTKLGVDNDEAVRAMVAEIMVERGIEATEARDVALDLRSLNGFKRDELGLYIEGRQLKAAIKEAANIRWAKKRWGPSNKGTLGYFAEHVFVTNDRLHLGVTEPTGVVQGFVHAFKVHAIKYEEYIEDAKIDFEVITDVDFSEKEWALLWSTGQQQGLGASRSQGFGRYKVTRWDRVD